MAPLKRWAQAYDRTLYRLAIWPVVALLALPCLGTARAAIDDLLELARAKTPSYTHAVSAAAKAIDLVHAAAGTSAIRNEYRFQQYFRNVHTMTQHAFCSASRYESVGALMLGVESDWALFAI